MDAPIPSSSFELPCRVTEMSGARSESDESERALTCWPTERRGKIALQRSKIRQTYLGKQHIPQVHHGVMCSRNNNARTRDTSGDR